MGIERILTREFFNTKIRDPDPKKTEIYYEINPIIKLKPTNYFRITITGWWSWGGVSISPNYPQLLMGLRFNGENHKCMSQIGDGPITNDLYYTAMNDMRQKTQDDKEEPGNQFNVSSVEPIQFYLDEFPTNLTSFYKALMGNIVDPNNVLFNQINYGFTLKLEELSKDTPYDYLPKIKQIYQQTFCEAVPSGSGYDLTKFYFNSYIKKNYKNKWLVSIINQTANSVSAGVLNFINMLRLIIPETNSSWIINDKQNLYKININMTLGANGSDGTADNVLVAWEYDDGTYSPYEIIAEAPVFGSTINITIYPQNPEGEDMPKIVGARITISGIDGITITEIFVNGVQSNNTGTINNPNEYRDYPITLTQSIDYLETSINGGTYGVRQYGDFIAQGKQPFPNQFLMNDITFNPFYGLVMRYNPNAGGLNGASAKLYGFTLQIEEMEI